MLGSRNGRRVALGLAATGLLGVVGCLKPTIQFVPTTLSMRRPLAIPDTYPLGSIVRAHYHTMETNGEAMDFVIHRFEFVRQSAELNGFGLDHLLEIAARARSAPFPVLIERSVNNSDPELDQHRRQMVAWMLAEKGVSNASARVIVSQSYDPGQNGEEAQRTFNRFINGGNQGGGGGGGAF
jgi:hypothetical protein